MRLPGECALEQHYPHAPRAVMGAVLRGRPHHLKLVRADATSMRFTFRTTADGFHLGEAVVADVRADGPGSMLRVSTEGSLARERTLAALREFCDLVGHQLDRGPSEPRSRVG